MSETETVEGLRAERDASKRNLSALEATRARLFLADVMGEPGVPSTLESVSAEIAQTKGEVQSLEDTIAVALAREAAAAQVRSGPA